MGDGVRGGKGNHYSIELDCITQDQAPSQPRAAPHPSHSLLCCWPSCSPPPTAGPELVGHTSQPRAVPTPHTSAPTCMAVGSSSRISVPSGSSTYLGLQGWVTAPYPRTASPLPLGGGKMIPRLIVLQLHQAQSQVLAFPSTLC